MGGRQHSFARISQQPRGEPGGHWPLSKDLIPTYVGVLGARPQIEEQSGWALLIGSAPAVWLCFRDVPGITLPLPSGGEADLQTNTSSHGVP